MHTALHRPQSPQPVTMFLAVLAMILAMSNYVHADPIVPTTDDVHLKTASTCTTAKGSVVSLPAGHFVTEAKYAAIDAEAKRLQNLDTRLTAENASFRAQAPTWTPGWKSLLSATLVGMATVLAIEHTKW